jgi:hypothetical protein
LLFIFIRFQTHKDSWDNYFEDTEKVVNNFDSENPLNTSFSNNSGVQKEKDEALSTTINNYLFRKNKFSSVVVAFVVVLLFPCLFEFLLIFLCYLRVLAHFLQYPYMFTNMYYTPPADSDTDTTYTPEDTSPILSEIILNKLLSEDSPVQSSDNFGLNLLLSLHQVGFSFFFLLFTFMFFLFLFIGFPYLTGYISSPYGEAKQIITFDPWMNIVIYFLLVFFYFLCCIFFFFVFHDFPYSISFFFFSPPSPLLLINIL